MDNARTSSPRVREKRRRARRDILAAARRILADRGVDAVTLAGVAGQLGLTKQAIYHYFPSKDALLSSLVTALLEAEIGALIAAVDAELDPDRVLGTLIRAFYEHHVADLDAFRLLYCQSQLVAAPALGMDAATIRERINPRTRQLFDILESRLARPDVSGHERLRLRRLAFTAWTSALGLLTMLSVADKTGDPLVHPDTVLLRTLAGVFDAASCLPTTRS